MRFSLCRCVVLLTLICAAVPAFAQQDRVGVVTAVNRKATGQPPDRPIEQLMIGSTVVRKEKISTFAKGQAQILFTDQSTITLGENSQIIIDDFVFDPKTGASQITATVSAGLVRYGGRISEKAGAEFVTPSGSVTVRGGGALITVKPKSVSSSDR